MMTIELDLPDFKTGSDAQQRKAHSNRVYYIQKLIDRGFDVEDIQRLLSVRAAERWWLEADLSVPKFAKHLSAVKGLITRYGSIEKAAEAQVESFRKERESSYTYRQLSQPMYKYKSTT